MLTRYGFATVVDTGSYIVNTVAIRKRIEIGRRPRPAHSYCGGPLYPPDGIPYYLGDLPRMSRLPQWKKRTKHNKLVFTHPSNVAGLQVALDANVDVLAHAIEDMRGWDDSYLKKMKAANMTLIPTLKLFDEDDDIQKILDEVMGYQGLGGRIMFGTDVGFLTDYNPSTEYELISRAGLTSMQMLASLTTAERFGEGEKRGRIAAGMQSDLVVLEADPAQEATNFTKVRYTIRRGQIIFPPPQWASAS